MQKFIVPGFLIGFGLLWLLNELELIPPVKIVWTLVLAAAGIGIFASRGFHKETFPWGAFFLICAVFSIFRQMGALRVAIEVPLILVALGIILGVNQTDVIPPAPEKK
ncbi:MAG: hypothetical protein JSR82_00290 [Verrucomicrobia bacterium]|nr:hypothetical protein [Verrucomicrobiota bacterium]